MSPSYLDYWYNVNGRLTLIGDLNIISGGVSFVLFILVALSSINSIAASLSWKEWNLVQTKIGIMCLLMAFVHSCFLYINILLQTSKKGHTLEYLLTRVKFYATLFPFLVLFLRLLFSLPPISRRIQAIREGIKH